jgi:hypothetical protein
MTQRGSDAENDLIDVRRAAMLVGRHPETIRRWVWSGRLAARRRDNRLLVTRDEVEAVARQEAPRSSLRAWADAARLARASVRQAGSAASAADLVIEDRQRRSAGDTSRAGR